VLLNLAGHLEKAAADLRRLASKPRPAPKPAIEPNLDDALIDIEEIIRHDEACSRRG
jgi:hypothetical protein